MPYKVLIVDDHPLVRDGLSGVLSALPGGVTVYTAENAAQALEKAEYYAPLDVVLLDYHLPDSQAEHLIPALKARCGGASILVISGSEDMDTVSKVMRYGATAFLPKSKASSTVLTAVKQSLAGEAITVGLTNLTQAPNLPQAALTARQLDVLFFLDQGLTNKQIALQLGTAEKTIKNHLSLLFLHLGTNNRLQATRRARDLGILK
jgi:DNA-binding NarL/FixJ family response regulator